MKVIVFGPENRVGILDGDNIVDASLAYVTQAKALAAMAIDMLADGARGAREVLQGARPPMTREHYLAFQRGLARRDVYEG